MLFFLMSITNNCCDKTKITNQKRRTNEQVSEMDFNFISHGV